MEFVSDMEQCETIEDCHKFAVMDANGEEEAAMGWLTCIEEMFSKFKRVEVLENTAILDGFDLKGLQVVATCKSKKGKLASVSLSSIEFLGLNENEKLWLDAVKNWNERY